MATQTSIPPSSSSPSSTECERDFNLSLEKKVAILEEKFAALERNFSHLHINDIIIMEDATGKVTDVPGNSATTSGATNESMQSGQTDTAATSRAKILINRFDPATGERKDERPSDIVPDKTFAQDTSIAFLLRKNVESNSQNNDGELEIVSRDLWNLLKKLLGHYPSHTFQRDPVPIYSPYEALVFGWDKLETATEESPTDEKDIQARQDLKLLLETISSGSGDSKLDKYFKVRESHKEQKSVCFEWLWTLFPPGELVYGKLFQDEDQIFIVQDNDRPWPFERSKPVDWTLQCWTYDWDGIAFKRKALTLSIESFEGYKPINSLPFYPLDHHQDPEDLKRRLVDRGAKYKRFCTAKQGSRMFDYKGPVLGNKKGFSRMMGVDGEDDGMTESDSHHDLDRDATPEMNIAVRKSTNIDSRVMVDFESYFRYGPEISMLGFEEVYADSRECVCLECQSTSASNMVTRIRYDKDAHQDKWEDEQFMLCPPRVLGYIFSDKQWAQLQVTLLQGIPKYSSKHSWDRVKLADGEDTKNLILNLVNGHGTIDPKEDDSGLVVDDIVAKKGKGLVILLYGPPGVGKTSTAETVAVAAGKPLFSISVADVGTEAKKVEANLSKIFALATSWQAILLIDEADVFLESRGKGAASSTERNALVSVFLRVLEYYQGILILTTNQIAHFDVAVQSRVHIAIKYTKLSRQQTMAIFDAFLKPLDDRSCVKEFDDITEWIKDDVCKVGLDGRQIRNIVTSALGLARAKGKKKLDKKDLKTVLDNVKEYKDDFLVQFEKYKNTQEGMVG